MKSSFSFNLLHLLDQCVSPSSLHSLQSFHAHLLSIPHLSSLPSVQLKLIRAFASCGDVLKARSIFDSVSNKNIVFFNVMIRGYVTHGLHEEAMGMFCRLGRHGFKPDCYTYPCVLKSCSESKDLFVGLQIHSHVKRLGFDMNLFVCNTLIKMYHECGVLEDALKVFDEMPKRDLVSWNVMISGISNNGFKNRAIEMFKEMVLSGKPKPDSATMASVLPAMTKALDRDIRFVRQVFDEMPKRELICWNAMIAIYSNNEMAKEAIELFLKMERETELEPDAVTLASVLPSCGALSAFELGKRIHKIIKTKKMHPNIILENSLLNMYSNCGSLKDARKVFDEMLERDIVSWTSIISAYGLHGHGHEALKLFDEMLESNLKPDSIAFVSVLSACSHSGLLNEGKSLFNSMVNKYKIIPKHEHYSCMVDLLGRAGCIKEAYDFIKNMPIAPNERAWGSLLNSCRVYSNLDVGLIVADNLFKLVPKHTGYYVLLSNIYAKAHKWHEVSLIRTIMSNKGIKKMPGVVMLN
ncbi:hypothetical protein LUZ60_015035 [Juncus effusus]|nr:hypothetical protein LUZ60_015035 [Juncus effusus]